MCHEGLYFSNTNNSWTYLAAGSTSRVELFTGRSGLCVQGMCRLKFEVCGGYGLRLWLQCEWVAITVLHLTHGERGTTLGEYLLDKILPREPSIGKGINCFNCNPVHKKSNQSRVRGFKKLGPKTLVWSSREEEVNGCKIHKSKKLSWSKKKKGGCWWSTKLLFLTKATKSIQHKEKCNG